MSKQSITVLVAAVLIALATAAVQYAQGQVVGTPVCVCGETIYRQGAKANANGFSVTCDGGIWKQEPARRMR